jgi:muramoyltetrapeptide carboxypeptidase
MRTLLEPARTGASPVRIGIVAPAGPVDPARLATGVDWLRGLGCSVTVDPAVLEVHGHLAGTDAARANALQAALCDPDLDLVLAARGGFGCARILPLLDYDRIAARRPLLAGYSDLTALQMALLARCGLASLHSPMAATEMGPALDTTSRESLLVFLTAGWNGQQQDVALGPEDVLVPGRAEGWLAGGNLSVLTSLAGTPYLPDLTGAVMLLEDYGEYPFRVDRHLCQLRNAGLLDRLAGVVLGHFAACEDEDPGKSTFTVDQLLEQYLAPLGIPVFRHIPFGHQAPRLTLPVGGRVLLDSSRGILQLRAECLASADEIR